MDGVKAPPPQQKILRKAFSPQCRFTHLPQVLLLVLLLFPDEWHASSDGVGLGSNVRKACGMRPIQPSQAQKVLWDKALQVLVCKKTTSIGASSILPSKASPRAGSADFSSFRSFACFVSSSCLGVRAPRRRQLPLAWCIGKVKGSGFLKRERRGCQ